MDVFNAAYRLAHDFRPDGAVGLARKLGINQGTFLNQLNPNTETHGLSLARALQMSVFTGDRRILAAFAAEMGCAVVSLPDLRRKSNRDLLALMLQRDREVGEFAQQVETALADQRISPRELEAIRSAGMEAVGAFLELMARFEEVVA